MKGLFGGLSGFGGGNDSGMVDVPDPFGIFPETGNKQGDTDLVSVLFDPGDLLGRGGARARAKALEEQQKAQRYWQSLAGAVPHQMR